MTATIPFEKMAAREVRDECLCFAAQRTARELARRFDRLFATLGITNQQFSMMVAIGGMGQPRLGHLARFLAMDHATLTAAIRTVEKRGWVAVTVDGDDRRSRRVSLAAKGAAVIDKALPLWRAEHAKLAAEIGVADARDVRSQMMRLASPLPAPVAG